jgi:hypothetical protein
MKISIRGENGPEEVQTQPLDITQMFEMGTTLRAVSRTLRVLGKGDKIVEVELGGVNKSLGYTEAVVVDDKSAVFWLSDEAVLEMRKVWDRGQRVLSNTCGLEPI